MEVPELLGSVNSGKPQLPSSVSGKKFDVELGIPRCKLKKIYIFQFSFVFFPLEIVTFFF